jgi:hypothetical protein
VSFKTFESNDIDLSGDESIKTVGLGLSTADALTCHMGGKLYVNDIRDEQKRSIATEAVF